MLNIHSTCTAIRRRTTATLLAGIVACGLLLTACCAGTPDTVLPSGAPQQSAASKDLVHGTQSDCWAAGGAYFYYDLNGGGTYTAITAVCVFENPGLRPLPVPEPLAPE